MSTKELEKTDLQELVQQTKELILHNDDYNTFDHVINCLVAICDHSEIQAEQCAFLVHYTGKTTVKKGTIEKLEPILQALRTQNLTAEIK